MREMLDEYMSWTPLRLKTARECTHELQSAVVKGFGAHTPMGIRFFEGLLWSMQTARGWNVEYVRVKPLAGMDEIAKCLLRMFRFRFINDTLTRGIISLRELELTAGKAHMQRHLKIVKMISRIVDIVVWRPASALMSLRDLVLGSGKAGAALIVLVAYALLRRRRRRRRLLPISRDIALAAAVTID